MPTDGANNGQCDQPLNRFNCMYTKFYFLLSYGILSHYGNFLDDTFYK